jgi:hypothetical protein
VTEESGRLCLNGIAYRMLMAAVSVAVKGPKIATALSIETTERHLHKQPCIGGCVHVEV